MYKSTSTLNGRDNIIKWCQTSIQPKAPEVNHGCICLQNLDDNNTGGGALNGGAPLDGKVNELKDHAGDSHHGNDLDSSKHELLAANISRGESFVSPAMYV